MSDNPDEVDLVRPYMVTGGRTQALGPALQLETLVRTTEQGLRAAGDRMFEQREVLSMCTRPTSIAEVASALNVPVGVARVLIGDLIAESLLDHAGATSKDEHLVRRLIDGVRSL